MNGLYPSISRLALFAARQSDSATRCGVKAILTCDDEEDDEGEAEGWSEGSGEWKRFREEGDEKVDSTSRISVSNCVATR